MNTLLWVLLSLYIMIFVGRKVSEYYLNKKLEKHWKKILIGEEKTLKHTSEDGSVKVEFSYRAGLLPNLALVGGLGLLVWWLVKK